jgi:two-component system cell cycle response regulator DivK
MIRILLVEDNPLNRELIQEFLEAWGYEVGYAPDGPSAIEEAKRVCPNLVLLDLQLPGKDGYQVLAELRTDRRLDAVKIVALTAFAMKGDREKALAAGFDGYHSKPIDSRSLRGEIEKLLASTAAV